MSDRMKAIGWLKKGLHLTNGPVGVMWSGNAFVGEVKDGKVYIDPIKVDECDNGEFVLPRRVIQAEVALQALRDVETEVFEPPYFGGDGKVQPPRSYVEEALAWANSVAAEQEERSPDPMVRLEERLIQIRDLIEKLTEPPEPNIEGKPLPLACLAESEGHLTISIRKERFEFLVDEALQKLQMSTSIDAARDADAKEGLRKWIIDEILYGLSLEANR